MPFRAGGSPEVLGPHWGKADGSLLSMGWAQWRDQMSIKQSLRFVITD